MCVHEWCVCVCVCVCDGAAMFAYQTCTGGLGGACLAA